MLRADTALFLTDSSECTPVCPCRNTFSVHEHSLLRFCFVQLPIYENKKKERDEVGVGCSCAASQQTRKRKKEMGHSFCSYSTYSFDAITCARVFMVPLGGRRQPPFPPKKATHFTNTPEKENKKKSTPKYMLTQRKQKEFDGGADKISGRRRRAFADHERELNSFQPQRRHERRAVSVLSYNSFSIFLFAPFV